MKFLRGLLRLEGLQFETDGSVLSSSICRRIFYVRHALFQGVGLGWSIEVYLSMGLRFTERSTNDIGRFRESPSIQSEEVGKRHNGPEPVTLNLYA